MRNLTGYFLDGIEIRRLEDESLDLLFLRTGEPEPLDGLHLDLGEQGVIDVGELTGCSLGGGGQHRAFPRDA